MKIDLTDVGGGFNLSAINTNFAKIEQELQNKVLYRDNPVGETNSVETDIDMNGKRIYNLPEPLSDNEPLRKKDAGDLSTIVATSQEAALIATTKATEAANSAVSSASSASTATLGANTATTKALEASNSATAAYDNSRLTVGSVTTGSAGTSAAVSINGVPGTQVIDFTIPRGDVGPTGPAGGVNSINTTLTGNVTGIAELTDITGGTRAASFSTLTINGNRITGEFDNTAGSSTKTLFQTKTPNSYTTIGAIPSASGFGSRIIAYNNTDTDNASSFTFSISPSSAFLNSYALGLGTVLPIAVQFGTAVAARFNTDSTVTIPKSLLVTGTALGFGTGAGGTVTQATSKTTAVTLDKACGQITTNNASLAGNTEISFVLNNSLLAIGDSLLIAGTSSVNYQYRIGASTTGATTIFIKNLTANPLSDILVITFIVIKGVLA